MELLVILLAEFLVVLFMPAIILTVELAALLIGLLIGLASWVLGRRSPAPPPSTVSPVATASGRRERAGTLKGWSGTVRAMTAVVLAGTVLTVGALVLVNTLFFEPVIRQMIGLVAKRTGAELEFRSVSGNLFTGRFTFEDIAVRRISESKDSFNLKVASLSADIDLLTLLSGPVSFRRLSVDTVSGTFHDRVKRDPDGAAHDGDGRIRTKRRFRIEDLALRNVDVALSKGDGAPVALSLTSLSSKPFRSNFGVFDVLFRSNVVGRIDGHDILISMREADGGRVTQWRMQDLPIASLSRLVAKPPISWLREGTLTVGVDDRWALSRQAEIDMDWSIRMQGVRAEARKAGGVLERAFALPIVSYINSKDGNVDLRFKLVMNESQFEDMLSPDAGVLWDTVVRSMSRAIAARAGTKLEDAERGIDSAVKGFKGFLDKVRKPPGSE